MKALSRLALVVMLGLPRAGEACSCPTIPTPRQALTQASAVFAGKVLEVYRHDPRNFRVTFEVSRYCKGKIGAQTIALTMIESSLCGYGFETGKEYIVYTYSDLAGRLRVSLCSRTRPLAGASEDLEALGPGEKPE